MGTATEMIVSPLELTRTTFCVLPASASATSGKFLPLRPANSSTWVGVRLPKWPFTVLQVRSISVIASSGWEAGAVAGSSERKMSPRRVNDRESRSR